MLRFEDPAFLWLLWVIPALVLVRLIGWRRRRAKLRKLGDPELLKQLMPHISKYRPTVKFVLMLAALALLIVMVARPQMGSKISNEKRNGIETIQFHACRRCGSVTSRQEQDADRESG